MGMGIGMEMEDRDRLASSGMDEQIGNIYGLCDYVSDTSTGVEDATTDE